MGTLPLALFYLFYFAVRCPFDLSPLRLFTSLTVSVEVKRELNGSQIGTGQMVATEVEYNELLVL